LCHEKKEHQLDHKSREPFFLLRHDLKKVSLAQKKNTIIKFAAKTKLLSVKRRKLANRKKLEIHILLIVGK